MYPSTPSIHPYDHPLSRHYSRPLSELFGTARLSAAAASLRIGVAAGTVGNDQAQKLAHPRAGRCLEDAAPLRRRLVAELEQRGGAPDAAVDERGIGAREMQRRHRDAVTIAGRHRRHPTPRSEEHTSELPSLMRISYAVFCL